MAKSDPAFTVDHGDAQERSLPDDLRELKDDALAALNAEIEFQKARASFAAGSLKGVAIFGIGAALLAFFALVALTVGLLMALSTLIGPLGATAVVVAAYLIIAGLLGWMAAGRWARMVATLDGKVQAR